MMNQSARFCAGHFFRMALFFLFLGMFAGCDTDKATENEIIALPETGDITMLIHFPELATRDSMPEAVFDLPSTAGGRFYTSDAENADLFRTLAEEADSAGKLLILVLPEGEQFSGIRDHLIIWINSRGIPVQVEPEIDSAMLSDSLWKNPVVRQETILRLVHFFKPDMIFQITPERESSMAITEYWSEHSAANNFTVALYVSPVAEINYRGWGVFTGKGIENRLLEGMNIQGFTTTVRMISRMNWNNPGYGYPAIQAFYATETE